MTRNKGPSLLLSFSFLLLGIVLHQTDGLAVMSVDLGSEFMKVAIVRPGVPMEIALNKESRRKTPVVVAMRNGERTLGDEALNTAVKYPKMAYWFMQSLVGKDMDHPQVKEFQERFPYYTLERDYQTGMPIFVHDDGNKFTVEELFAMVLENAKQTAESFAEQPISEAVITVPPYFNQAERRAMLRAAEFAGLKVLQLMNDNAAVALNYGVFRSKSFNKTASHYMFVDVGSGSTTATVVAYQIVDSKNAVTGIKESNPQVTVKGVGFDRTLGGVEFQLRLRDHLAKLFDKSKKTKMDLYSNDRAMAKLFKEAGRLMKVLSANTAHVSQIEGLLDDEDFKAKVTRAEFEEMCADLFQRFSKPLLDALKSSEVTWEEINEVILMGGGTRIPKIQEDLLKTIGREELGKSINTDEAAALGAVYQAAHLSKGFKVKKFIVKDANLYPIQVEFERAKKDDQEVVEESKKMVKRTLFGFLNPYPQKKVMTFNKHVSDFTFEVNYGEQDHLSEEQMKTFGSKKLQKITLTGVGDAFTKHSTSSAESKGVKAHFRMDESGILLFEKAESLFERSPDAEPEEESTLSKLGNFFFGGSENKDKVKTDESTEEKKDKEKEGEKKEEKTSDEQKKEQDESKKTKEASGAKKSDSEKVEPESKKKSEKVESKTDKSNGSEADESTNQDSDDPEEKEKTGDQDKKPEEGEEKKEEEEKKTDDEQKEKEEEGEKKEEQKEEKTEGEKEDKKENSKDEKKEEKKEEEKKKEQKPKTIKEQLKSEFKLVDINDPSEEQLKASRKMIKDLKKKDEEKLLLAKATNDLESFIIDVQDKLYQEDYEKCSTEDERTQIQANFSAASDWLYEQDETVGRKAYEDKLSELKKLTRKLFERVREYQERPKALEALNSIMNYTEHFLVGMKNYTGEDQPFTEVEYTTLEKLINETKEWNETSIEEQAKTPLTKKPKMSVEDIARKINDLDREVKYLISKAKYFRPKAKPTEEKKSNKTKTANNTINTNETKTEEKPTAEDKEAEKREPVADGATDAEEPKEDGADDGVKMDIPPMPGSEEEVEAKNKEKQKKKDKDSESAEEEETLQLDAADKDTPAEDTEKSDKSSRKSSHHGHDPDDEL